MLGIFEMAWFLRGLDNFLMDLISDRTFCEVLLDRLVEVKCRLYERYLEDTGPYLDVVTMGDDISGQRGPLFDPAIYRELIKPRHAALIRFIKQRTPAKLFFHSCGDVTEFIPDFIEIGVDILNPIQVSVMDPSRLKSEFGDRLVFWGGCDTQRVLPFGTTQEVETEVRRRMEEMAAGGGYIFGQVHEVQPGTPPENILAMFRSALRYGMYGSGNPGSG
jgi:uroporphyrinogen decarboxylase